MISNGPLKGRGMWFVSVLILMACVFGVPTPAAADPSPTGRSPRFIWTPERQAVWNQMKAEYQAGANTLGAKWFGLLKSTADSGSSYNDYGLFATMMYQITGDTQYVAKALAKMTGGNVPWLTYSRAVFAANPNFVREYSADYVVMYDWLYPGLTPAQRSLFQSQIESMLEAMYLDYGRRGDVGDSDQTVGVYFGLALAHEAFNSPRTQALVNLPFYGGLDATAIDGKTFRNAIRYYVELQAAGGEWFESHEYNLGTTRLLMLGVEALRTARGFNHFPEVTPWYPQFAEMLLANWTPDLQQNYQWGDEEHARGDGRFEWSNTLGMIAGLVQGSDVGARAQDLLYRLVETHGAVGFGTMDWSGLSSRLLYFYNPYATRGNWTAGPKASWASGQGLMMSRGGFGANDSLTAIHFGTRPLEGGFDHLVRFFGDVEIYKNGEWALTHPRGYAKVNLYGIGTNSVMINGLDDLAEMKRSIAGEGGTGYSYAAAVTGGSVAFPGQYAPPPPFTNEWTRSFFHLPGTTDTIILVDRAHVTGIPNRADYGPYSQILTAMDNAMARKVLMFHAPNGATSPTATPGNLGWTTARGQNVRVRTLLPATNVTFHNSTYGGDYGVGAGGFAAAFPASEVGPGHFHVTPVTTQDWDTFLTVVQAGPGTAYDLVQQAGEVAGVRVTRSGTDDALVLFNAKPSASLLALPYGAHRINALTAAHLRRSGFGVSWIAQSVGSDVFLADLHPGGSWTYSIDGGAPTPLAVSAAGIGKIRVNGGGSHTLTVSVTGIVDLPSAPSNLRLVP